MTIEKDNKLYIPLGVRSDREIFSGFGRRQLLHAIIGTVCFAAIALLVYFLSKNIAFVLIVFMFGVVGSVMMSTKDQSNLSVVDQVQNIIRFMKGQKFYPYRYKNPLIQNIQAVNLNNIL